MKKKSRLQDGQVVTSNWITVDEDNHADIPFTRVTNDIARDGRFTPKEKVLYLVLCSHSGSNNWCWLSVKTLLAESGIKSNRDLYAAMDVLIECGLVVKYDDGMHNSKAFFTTHLIHDGWTRSKKVKRPMRAKDIDALNAYHGNATSQKDSNVAALLEEEITNAVTEDYQRGNGYITNVVNEEEPLEEEHYKNINQNNKYFDEIDFQNSNHGIDERAQQEDEDWNAGGREEEELSRFAESNTDMDRAFDQGFGTHRRLRRVYFGDWVEKQRAGSKKMREEREPTLDG